MIWFILFIIILALACYSVYKSAEVHELHKMRAAFEDKRHDIAKLIEENKNSDNFNVEYYNGELQELDEIEALIDEELEVLKYFDI